jgi:hypothetical protein
MVKNVVGISIHFCSCCLSAFIFLLKVYDKSSGYIYALAF